MTESEQPAFTAPPGSSPGLLRGTSIVSSLTLLSRLLGFVREILVARLFGAGAFADAYFVALRIPNLLRSIFAEGALTSAFVPVFSKELLRGRGAAQEAISSMVAVLLWTTLFVSGIGIWLAPEIVHLFAPGFGIGTDRFDLCVLLTRIMFPYIIFVSLIAMLNGALNSVKIFGASAWAQVVMNIVLIIAAYVAGGYASREGAIILASSVVLGGVAQIVAQIPALRRSGFSLVPSSAMFTAPVKQVFKLMVPAIMGAAVYQVAVFLSTQLASVLEPGSVAWLSYADRLTQLPIGVFTIALASVLLPALSHAQASSDAESFGNNLVNSLRYTSFLMIPGAAFLLFYAQPLITLMFERGQFTPESSTKTAMAVQMYALGLWGVSCHSMVVRAFNAKHDTRTPTLIGVFSLLSTFFFSLLLMGRPHSEHSSLVFERIASLQAGVISILPSWNLGHGGLALASSISFTLSFLFISTIFATRFPGVRWRAFIAASIRAIAGAGVMLGALSFLPHQVTSPTFVLLTGALVGASSYIFVLWALKSPELKETFVRISRLLIREKRSPH